ncbi:tryptophan synthase subunit alpha [Methanothrix harundinacea]|jgi:tryptophan synthase alpha chain|uniref:Tryptophan synthase alpha chain n=1 Tax=Methanothrix harundinacea (strain 6Ac) TaxID=1110509 RepID=G7WR28_METH6|nr:tryptophan synthase subunit alpha [Methanothrix harundinacea]AET65331.1 Tryptophan synthase, alpha subunit [Methanothrix harundinacea 6Ac]
MRLAEAFRRRPLLIAYICAGDPSPEATVEVAELLARAGADVVELGLPHSDPIADGPVIQAAAQRAIEAGMNTDVYFETASRIRAKIPLVFMGYYNMIYQRGLEKFAGDCGASGITGLIVPDLPPEEAGPLRAACRRADLDLISLIAPNTPAERIPLIAENSSGFLYLVARAGVTGARSEVLQSTKALIERVNSELPRAVGFGISTPEQAAEVIRAGADAAIVGSACVDLISKGDLAGLEELIRGMKAAIGEARPIEAAARI